MSAIRSQITDTEIAGGGVGLVKIRNHPRDRKYAEASTISYHRKVYLDTRCGRPQITSEGDVNVQRMLQRISAQRCNSVVGLHTNNDNVEDSSRRVDPGQGMHTGGGWG